MTINSNQLPIKFLFEQNHTFEVPKYQRGYAWEDEAIEDFIDDIARCLKTRWSNGSRNHFFGGVVTVRKTVPNSNRSNFEVIDGQQRLASFVMLVAAIKQGVRNIINDLDKRGALREDEEEAKAFLQETIETLHNTYLVYRDQIELKYVKVPKLTLSKADDDFFQSILSSSQNTDPKRASHERIQAAWNRLAQFVEKDVLEGAAVPRKAKRLQVLVSSVLTSDCSVIFMCSESKSEAYQIFQVLNDRGVHLTDGDLLRASTMEILDQDALIPIQNKVADTWDNVLAYPPRDIDSYLRWYFSSWEGKRPKSSNLAGQFLEFRFQCNDLKEIEEEKAKETLEEVQRMDDAFATLRTLGDGEWPYADHSQVARWDRERLRMLVTYLDHTNAMPLLLSLQLLDSKDVAEAVSSIERFVFRYKTIGNIHPGPMTALYLKHAKKIRETENYSIRKLKKDLADLVKKYVPDSVFKANLRALEYSPRGDNKHIKYLFITLEEYSKWHDQGAKGAPKCMNKSRVFDFSNTTLEHVYPQSPEEDKKNLELEDVKHTLGNLTILGPTDNRELSNKSFDEKRSIFTQSDLKLNRDIAENDDWNADIVDQRTNTIVEMALKIFIP